MAERARSRAVTTATLKRRVRKVHPSAQLHSWRILGDCGHIVYGILEDEGWLAFGASTARAAWEWAWERVQRKATDGEAT